MIFPLGDCPIHVHDRGDTVRNKHIHVIASLVAQEETKKYGHLRNVAPHPSDLLEFVNPTTVLWLPQLQRTTAIHFNNI